MKRNRKAKILATLGPASSDIKIIEDLFVAGCDVFRLNFSHGDLETHRKNYETIRSLEEKHNHASCILADLQGPKLRVGIFKDTKEVFTKLESLNYQIAVVTNTANNLAKGILSYAELYPKILIGGDDVVNGKPEPDMLFLACERLSLTPSEVLMIGDSKFDKKAAEKAGIYFIGINGINSEKTINSLNELMALI